MTQADIAKLRALLAVATPRPWKDQHGFNNGGCPTRFFCIPGHNSGATVELMEADSVLLVAAVNALPALLDEIERMRPVYEAACYWRDDHRHLMDAVDLARSKP